MPRVTYVKSARALYATKPVLNEDGTPKRTLVTKKDGTPKTTKTGREVFHAVTVRDLDKPKPCLRCDFPNCDIDGGEIKPGTSYKFMALRFRQLNRHAQHPSWAYWEYSSSVAAQAARLQSEMSDLIDGFEFTTEDDFDSCRDELAGMAQEFADERQESVDNMPEQLQEGSQAQEYAEAAESWVGEIEQADSGSISAEAEGVCEECEGDGEIENPDWDDEVEVVCDTCGVDGEFKDADADSGVDVCPDCDGTGTVENDANDGVDEKITCPECEGSGKTGDDGLSEDWIEEARQVLREAVESCEI